jgi:large subunit ribosomal protein L4
VQLDFLDERGEISGRVDASDLVFARPYNEALIHQIVVAYQANARRGTRAQLGRDNVSSERNWACSCWYDQFSHLEGGWSCIS